MDGKIGVEAENGGDRLQFRLVHAADYEAALPVRAAVVHADRRLVRVEAGDILALAG